MRSASAGRAKPMVPLSLHESHPRSGWVCTCLIEEVLDECVYDHDVPRVYRRAFVSAVNRRDTNADQWDELDETLEEMSDASFHQLIQQGVVVPIPSQAKTP